jgi:hypothetical protein
MILFLKLLFVHFLTEYPFQTNKVFEWKSKHLTGVALHVCIYLSLALAVTWTEWRILNSLVLFILATAFVHFCIDEIKNIYIRRTKRDDIYAFLIDQILHVLTLLVLFWVYPLGQLNAVAQSTALFNEGSLAFAVGIILSTYASSIFIYYLRKTYFNVRLKYERDYLRMFWRLALYGLWVMQSYLIILGVACWFVLTAKKNKPKGIYFKGFQEILDFVFAALSYILTLIL